MTALIDQLLAVPAAVAYPVIGVLVFAEAALLVGFVVPGETAALLGGVLAAGGRLSLSAVLVLVVVAAVAGDSVGYEIGRRLGPRILATPRLRRHADRLDRAGTMLRRRGGSAVVVARFTAFLRAVMPALAGAGRMPYRRFLAYNAAGALGWGAGVTLLGFFAGHSLALVERDLGMAGVVALAAVGLGLGMWALVHRVRTSRRRRGDAGRSGSAGPPPHGELTAGSRPALSDHDDGGHDAGFRPEPPGRRIVTMDGDR